MDAKIKKITQKISDLFIHYTLPLFVALYFIATGAILFHLNYLSEKQVRLTAMENAKIYSETLTEFRSLYTTEVVVAARKFGMSVSHDYKSKEGAIPLPATLSMQLGNRIGGTEYGTQSRLYSNYPFPWREKIGGLSDDFARAAWEFLQVNPAGVFTQFEDVEGKYSLRYATADIMRQGCVDCHNNHLKTPKADWHIGDVRGVLEVIIPVTGSVARVDDMLFQTFLMLSSFLFISLVIIVLVVKKLQQRTIEAKAYGEATAITNQFLEKEVVARKKAETKLRIMSHVDSLTGLYNRRHFDESMQLEWKRAVRFRQPIALLMVDIDDFKRYNDHYGHQAGDKCLSAIAQQIKTTISRETDVVARYGGEEFVVILPATCTITAIEIAQKIRGNIEALAIVHEYASSGNYVTVSVGVASVIPDSDVRCDELLSSADQALYQAKHSGRNRVMTKDNANDKV
tara:strand:+ start:22533 stop:23903 length:1371 start_codon:yes stop_codon:yes gene_type:complete